MRHSARAALSSLIAGLLALAQALGDGPDTAWLDFAEIAAGETVVQTGRDGSAVTVDVATRIDAPKAVIFAVLRECEIAPELVPHVVACSRIDSINEGRSELFVQTVKPVFFVPRFEHVFRLDYFPYERIDVHRVSGPIEEMDGTWWLIDQDDGSVLLVHSLRLEPGFPVPRFFVRATLRRDLPNVVDAIRERAEARAAAARP